MREKTLFIISLLLMPLLLGSIDGEPSRKSETIHIRADGSIDPPTANITSTDNITYTFTDNNYDSIGVERDNIVIDGANYMVMGTGSGTGIQLLGRDNVTLKNIKVTNFEVGIYLVGSNNNVLNGNIASSNLWVSYINGFGIYLDYSNNNALTNNTASSNDNVGICLTSSINNTLTGNTVFSNGNYGIDLSSSNNNTLTGNTASNNEGGIVLYESIDNVITNNTITSNWVGIRFQSPNNVIFHNNLVNNTSQASKSTNLDVKNRWDNGYPSGGNYWDNYTGVDDYQGPNQDILGSDGIGDTPYVVDANNTDYYPLMNPWGAVLYELTVNSSPISGISFTINGIPQIMPYTDMLPEGSYLLEMPQTHYGYEWSHWLEDEDPNRIKTIALNTNTTLTTVFTPDTTPPTISVASPENKTHPVEDIPLTFTVSESTSWIGYSLDSQSNVTISGNTTIIGLLEGTHTITVYANDTDGNMGLSDLVYFSIHPEAQVGVKAGDWIKCDYTVTGWSSGTPYPEWLKVEILSVEGTTATVRATMHMDNGTEQSDTLSVDVVTGCGAFDTLFGFIIPANCTTGDSIMMGGDGLTFNVTIDGEITRTYVGASRRVVFASFSQHGTELIYYWDKQTGILVESGATSGDMIATGIATETNMWQPNPFWMQWWLWFIIALAVIAFSVAVSFLMKRKLAKSPSQHVTWSVR